MKLKLEALIDAKRDFDKYSSSLKTKHNKLIAIRAFMVCHELSWKMMEKILERDGIYATTLKSVFRKAAVKRLIDDPELWFEFQDGWHSALKAKTFKDVKRIWAVFYSFSVEVDSLINRIKELIESQDI